MNHTPAEILYEYLISTAEIFTLVKNQRRWPLYIERLPDGENVEDDAACIYTTTGVKDGRIMSSGASVFHYGIQLRIRSREYASGYQKAQEVADDFATVANQTVTVERTEYEIAAIAQTTEVIPIGGGIGEGTEDFKALRRREQFTVNFLVTVKEVES